MKKNIIELMLHPKFKTFMLSSVMISFLYLFIFLIVHNQLLRLPQPAQIIILIGAFGSVGFIGIVIIYIKLLGDLVERSAQQEKQMNVIQLNYLTNLLEKENATKHFRHDLRNHMMYLDSLAIQNKSELIHEYITQMNSIINSVEQKIYNTGNDILNAILNYYLYYLDSSIPVTISGKLTANTTLNDAEFCSVFSNLIQNAVEELISATNSQPVITNPEISHFLNISIKQGNEFACIEISNSILQNPHKKYHFEDKYTAFPAAKLHGFGQRNVIKYVKKADGKIDIKKEFNSYTVSVILKLINTR